MNEIISVMFHLEWIQRGKPTQSYKHVKKLIYGELKKKNGNTWWASGTGRTWGERKRTKTGDKRTHSNVRLMGAGSWTFGKGAGRWWGEIQVSRWSTSVKVRSEESVPNAVLQGANRVNRRAILVGVAAEGWREDEDYSSVVMSPLPQSWSTAGTPLFITSLTMPNTTSWTPRELRPHPLTHLKKTGKANPTHLGSLQYQQ